MKIGRRTSNSSHQIYHRRRRWKMEFITAAGTKLNEYISEASVIDSKYIKMTGLQDFYDASSFTDPFQEKQPEVFCKRRCSSKFEKFHRKRPLLESLFNKILGSLPTQVFFRGLCKIFSSIYFKEHLQTIASGTS